jgi:hypothetical protein
MDFVFANTAEAFIDILASAATKIGGLERIRRETALSQRALFWLSDDKVVVTPSLIPQALLRQCKRATRWNNVVNLAPRGKRLDLCTAVLEDSSLFAQIIELLHDNPGSTLSAYAPTKHFARLAHELRAAHCNFTTFENLSSDGLVLQSYLDTKEGFRIEATKLKSSLGPVFIPEGFVCADDAAVEKAITWFFAQAQGCVVKSNRGESGWGTLILNCDQSVGVAISTFRQQSKIDTIWEYTPFIVEEYIRAHNGNLLSPSVEVLITDWNVEITYSCDQVTDSSGQFHGVIIGPSCLPTEIRREIENVGHVFGRHYQKLGYRGYFDADFIVRDEAHIFVLETNMRRTGGTHVFDLVRAITPLNNRLHYLSEDLVDLREVSAGAVLDLFEKLLFDGRMDVPGMIPTIIDVESNTMGYIAIGQNIEDVLNLQHTIRNIISLNERLQF